MASQGAIGCGQEERRGGGGVKGQTPGMIGGVWAENYIDKEENIILQETLSLKDGTTLMNMFRHVRFISLNVCI